MDYISKLARVSPCPHKLPDMEKCLVCDSITFDRPLDSLKDLLFEDLLICSPRNKVPTEAELADIVKRLKGENALIELDAKTKFKRQKDYVQLHMHQGTSGGDVHAATVQFTDTLDGDRRETLFPKKAVLSRLQTYQSSNLTRVNSIRSEPSGVEPIVLVQGDQIITQRIRIFLPPYDEETSCDVVIDATTTAATVVQAVSERADPIKTWELRWTDETEPDYDLPPIDAAQILYELNVGELCLANPEDRDDD